MAHPFHVLHATGGRIAFVLAVAALVAGTAYLWLSSRDRKPEPNASPAASVSVRERMPESAEEWNRFVSSVKERCAEQGTDCALDYESLHEHGGRSFGVLVIAWQYSEYEVNLFRYDPETKGWQDSPVKQNEFGSEVDVQTASKKWDVPPEKISLWLQSATDFMKKKYDSGGD